VAPNLVDRLGLARTGGKQAILKRADHRFIKRIEFESHNGHTSFRGSGLLENIMIERDAARVSQEDVAEKFRQPRMLRPARFAFMVKREPHPALYFWLTISNGVAGMGSYLNGSRGALTDGNEGWGCSVWITRDSENALIRCAAPGPVREPPTIRIGSGQPNYYVMRV